MRILKPALLALALITCQQIASASVQVVGGSLLSNPADAAQIGSWLGRSVTLTNIFDKTTGDGKTAVDFHAAADGKGETIVLYKVTGGSYYNGVANAPVSSQIIGGYNPSSWVGNGGYNLSVSDAARIAFIFNLTSNEKQSQKLSNDPTGDSYIGQYQTYNDPNYGPAFGAGHDISIYYNLVDGWIYNYSYGTGVFYDPIVTETAAVGYATYLTYGEIEVYTISALADVSTPEPASIAIWTLMMSGVGCCAYPG